MRKYNDSGWEKVGTLPVDAGCIMLMDPCYTEGHDDHRAGGAYNSKWYTEQIVDRCHEGKGGVHEVSGRETGPGSGMIIPSGFGDGYYNVYVRYSDEGSWGTRVAEVKVVFIDDEEEDEECYLCGASIDDGYCGDCSDDDD